MTDLNSIRPHDLDQVADTPHLGAKPTTEALNAAALDAAHLGTDVPRREHLIDGGPSGHYASGIKPEDMRHRAEQTIHDYPWAVLAGGLLVGILMGLSIPRD